MTKDQQERAMLLLDVTQKMMIKCHNTRYVENILELTEHWDGVDCDGYCLLEDINNLLSEIEGNV